MRYIRDVFRYLLGIWIILLFSISKPPIVIAQEQFYQSFVEENYRRAMLELLKRQELSAIETGYSEGTGPIGKRIREATRRAELQAEGSLARQLTNLTVNFTRTGENERYQDYIKTFKLRFVEKVSESEPKELPDGSYCVTVTLRIPLGEVRRFGEGFLEEMWKVNPPASPYPNYITKLEQTVISLTQQVDSTKCELVELRQELSKQLENFKTALKDSISSYEQFKQKSDPLSTEYTGLIVITNGFHMQPSNRPSIYTETDLAMYHFSHIQEGILDYWYSRDNWGMSGFAEDVESAKRNFRERVGTNPLIVKASGVRGRKWDVIVNHETALEIFNANYKRQFLQEARVVFVIDQSEKDSLLEDIGKSE